MRAELKRQGLSEYRVSSAGTLRLEPGPASEFSALVAREFGTDISAHISRHLDKYILEKADIVLAMEEKHRHYIYTTFGPRDNVFLLTEYPELKGGRGIDDPIGQSLAYYRRTGGEIHTHIERIVGILAGD